MAVNQTRYQKVGTMYAKKFYNRALALAGSVEAIGGFLIPPYVVPRRYWLKCRVASVEGTTAFAPHYFTDYKLDGRVVSLPASFDADLAANDTLQEMMNVFAPHGDNSQPFDEAVGVQAAYGKIGTAEEDKTPLGAFFTREQTLGLPSNALFQSADSIFLFDYFKTKGVFPKTLKDVEEGSFLVFQAWTDEPAAGTNELTNLIGSATANRSLNDLSAEILNHFQNESMRTEILSSVDVDQEMMNWLSVGIISDALPTLTGDESIHFSLWLTVEMDVLIPTGANSVSAP